MSSKYSRSGGKFTGNHMTLIPAGCTVADIANACGDVFKITPGFIKAGLRSVSGKKRLKVTQKGGNYLWLQVRDNTSQQELHVYSNNIQKTIDEVVAGAKDAGIITTVQR